MLFVHWIHEKKTKKTKSSQKSNWDWLRNSILQIWHHTNHNTASKKPRRLEKNCLFCFKIIFFIFFNWSHNKISFVSCHKCYTTRICHSRMTIWRLKLFFLLRVTKILFREKFFTVMLWISMLWCKMWMEGSWEICQAKCWNTHGIAFGAPLEDLEHSLMLISRIWRFQICY